MTLAYGFLEGLAVMTQNFWSGISREWGGIEGLWKQRSYMKLQIAFQKRYDFDLRCLYEVSGQDQGRI